MFHNRTLNHKINKLHERALRIVYNEEELSFQDMLNKDGSVTIHRRNLQKLAIEMYKIKNQISTIPMQKLFTVKEYHYDLRNKNTWVSDNIRTVKYSSETVSNMGPKTWELVPNAIRVDIPSTIIYL